jgi:hypothetical protein
VTDKRPTYVIVGASPAGAKAAETLGSEGFDGRSSASGPSSTHRMSDRLCRSNSCAASPSPR